MKESINTLVVAVGLADDSTSSTNKSTTEILSIFSESTERQKNTRNAAPDPNIVGRISGLPTKSLMSTKRMAMKRMGRSKKSQSLMDWSHDKEK